jgi:hypothetical protein
MTLLNLIDKQIFFLGVEGAIFGVEESKFAHDSLVAGNDVKLSFVFNWAFVKSDHVHVNDELVDLFQRAWNTCQASLYFLTLYLCH